MTRKTFLTIASIIAVTVGLAAISFPGILLESKGVNYNSATVIWMMEVGLLLMAIGIMAFLVRGQPDSQMLQAFFISNIVIQAGLFLIESIAFANGIVTKLSGVLPNLFIHILLATGFCYYLRKMSAVKMFVYND